MIFIRVVILTCLALIAFAANSVLCRLALRDTAIDPASFTVLRLISGAVVLFLLWRFTTDRQAGVRGSWLSAFMLFVYAAAFSYAYIVLDAAVGALILFASVQITMIFYNNFFNQRLLPLEWLGVVVACCGFLYMVWPNLTEPSLKGFIWMSIAGIAWGAYSLKGRVAKQPLAETAFNFLRSLVFAVPLVFVILVDSIWSTKGVVLAVISGAITSGVGYAIWYQALRYLSTTVAAIVQLLVPIITAAGGLVWLSEPISMRLLLAAVLVLGGILIVVLANSQGKRAN